MKILFVCTGNTCRSCMAEGIFNYKIKTVLAGNDIEADSAGVYANQGEPASVNSIKVLKDIFGIDINMHRAKIITEKLMEQADIVLAMTRNHKAALINMFPDREAKIFTFLEYISDNTVEKHMLQYDFRLDVPDPYGMHIDAYKKCAENIHMAVDKLIEKLKNKTI